MSGLCSAYMFANLSAPPNDLAADGAVVYWSSQNKIHVIDEMGGLAGEIGSIHPTQIAAAEGVVYWIDSPTPPSTTTIHSRGWNGSPAESTIVSDATGATAIRINATRVFWSLPGSSKIGFVPKGGGAVAYVATGAGSADEPDFAVDDTRVYWWDGAAIKKATIPSLFVSVVASPVGSFERIAADQQQTAGRVLWATTTGIYSAPKAGGGGTPFAAATKVVRLLADQKNAYWLDLNTSCALRYKPLESGSAADLPSSPANCSALFAQDANALYWIGGPSGLWLMRMVKPL